MLIDIYQFQVSIKCGEVFRIVEDTYENNQINSASVLVAQLTSKTICVSAAVLAFMRLTVRPAATS